MKVNLIHRNGISRILDKSNIGNVHPPSFSFFQVFKTAVHLTLKAIEPRGLATLLEGVNNVAGP